ncbi:MAG: glycosyltransferase family 2 protein [Lishizhenia sp.]
MNTVTIGMPVYNDIDFIEESLKSILNQSFINFKLIISDDGASDGSEIVCQQYANKDNRIEYVRQTKNLGISENMQFLLARAKSKYFMWAADDDLWHKDFLKNTVELLENNLDCIVAFCKYDLINENKTLITQISKPHYRKEKTINRLKTFIKDSDDGFGYALFKREQILEVKFPTWWWINKTTPYNNIYPTLCYYLTKGNYIEFTDYSLFYKRVKSGDNINHKIIGEGNAFKETFAFILRKFNLITFSSKEIRKHGGIPLMLAAYPSFFYYWFIKPSVKQTELALTSFYKNRIKKS